MRRLKPRLPRRPGLPGGAEPATLSRPDGHGEAQSRLGCDCLPTIPHQLANDVTCYVAVLHLNTAHPDVADWLLDGLRRTERLSTRGMSVRDILTTLQQCRSLR